MVKPASNAQMIGLPERCKLEKKAIELIYCSSCGAKNTSANNFCPECGKL